MSSQSLRRAASASSARDYGADERSDQLGLPARDVREDARQQVDTAAMPGRFWHRPAYRCLQDPVRIRDHELHTSKTVVLQAREGDGPEHGVLRVPHVDTEDLTAPSAVKSVAITTAQDDLKVHARRDEGRIQEHVQIPLMFWRTLADGCDPAVDVRTDSRRHRFRRAGISSLSLDEVIHRSRGRAGHAGDLKYPHRD